MMFAERHLEQHRNTREKKRTRKRKQKTHSTRQRKKINIHTHECRGILLARALNVVKTSAEPLDKHKMETQALKMSMKIPMNLPYSKANKTRSFFPSIYLSHVHDVHTHKPEDICNAATKRKKMESSSIHRARIPNNGNKIRKSAHTKKNRTREEYSARKVASLMINSIFDKQTETGIYANKRKMKRK